MKKFLLFSILCLCSLCLSSQDVEINGCHVIRYYTYDHGSSLSFWAYGNVFVETDPRKTVELLVRIVDSPEKATYNVYKTTDTPKECGEWRFVNDRSKAKFTIRYVKDQEDCRVYFTQDRREAGF